MIRVTFRSGQARQAEAVRALRRMGWDRAQTGVTQLQSWFTGLRDGEASASFQQHVGDVQVDVTAHVQSCLSALLSLSGSSFT